MATQPTQNPVPSESPRDLKFNAGKIDEFVTSLALKYQDRFGTEHYTIEGLRQLAQEAIAAFGWIPVDSFQDGATLTLPNQVLRDESTGEYYRWDGVQPKEVPPGSTPASTGGVGKGAWLSVGDAALRSYIFNDVVGFVTPEMFNAPANGAGDDSPAFSSAFATGKAVVLMPGKKYNIASNIIIPSNSQLYGYNSTINLQTNVSGLTLGDNVVIDSVSFTCPSTLSSVVAVYINNKSRTKVINCKFNGIKGSAYCVENVVDSHQGNILTSSSFTLCTIGIDIRERGEYTNISSCNLDQCDIGISITGGNTLVNSCVVSNCRIAFKINGGENDAHGRVVGCLINHSVEYALIAESTNVKEFKFDSCSFYYGSIWLRGMTGLFFDNCSFSTNSHYFENSFQNYYVNCHFYANPVFNHRWSNTQSSTDFINCKVNNAGSASVSRINGSYLSANLSNSVSLPAGETKVKLDNILANSKTFDINYTYFKFYDTATGAINISQDTGVNTNFSTDVNLIMSIGVTGSTFDPSKILVYLKTDDTNQLIAVAPYAGTFTASGTTFGIYQLNGPIISSLLSSSVSIRVNNQAGSAVTLFKDQPGAGVFTSLKIAGF